jgi:hypothetical protein
MLPAVFWLQSLITRFTPALKLSMAGVTGVVTCVARCLELPYFQAYTRRFGAVSSEQALERAKNEVPRLSEQLL